MFNKQIGRGKRDISLFVTEHNIKVDATICKSGDVLIRVMAPGNEQFFEWFSVDNIFSREVASISLFSQAVAEEVFLEPNAANAWFDVGGSQGGSFQLAQYGPRVLCQRWLDNVLLVRRVAYPNGACFDETVNTYNGYVVNSVPSPCAC